MKYNILITDILIKDFVHVYKKDFSVDCLWKLESKIDFSKSELKKIDKYAKDENINLWSRSSKD